MTTIAAPALCLLMATSLAVSVQADAQEQKSEGISQITTPNMTIFSLQQGEDQPVLVPDGGIIRAEIGDCYGWQITFPPINDQIELREVLTLPATAEQWNTGPASRVADDLMSSSTVHIVSGHTGYFLNAWCVAPGDPYGQYHFTIYNGRDRIGEATFMLAPEE